MNHEPLWTGKTFDEKSKGKRWIPSRSIIRCEALAKAKLPNVPTAKCEVCHLVFPLDYIKFSEASWIKESLPYCKDHFLP